MVEQHPASQEEDEESEIHPQLSNLVFYAQSASDPQRSM